MVTERRRDLAAGAGAWLPPGTRVTINGLVISGGLLYVGRRLSAVDRQDADPALIDPSLPVDLGQPDVRGTSLGYWVAYSRISPKARAGYLHWLWTGRQSPRAPIGYVLLYFYGLERRVLHDCLVQPEARPDIPIIAAEIDRLLRIYRRDSSFRSYATSFRQVLDVLMRRGTPVPGAVGALGPAAPWELPAPVRFELARLAAARIPLPVEWALAWASHAPDIALRTPAQRCPDEFSRLFSTRYPQVFGAGLPLASAKKRLRLSYRAASPSFVGAVTLPVGDLPDPAVLRGPTDQLAAFAGSITDELDAYSRWLGRHPDGRGTLGAVALLPAELATGPGAEVADAFIASLEAAFAGRSVAVVDAGVLIRHWPAASAGRLVKAESAALAQLLATRGIGLEPDARFGGPVVAGPVVVFRGGTDARPAAGWVTASAIIELAVELAVAEVGAGGTVGLDECATLVDRLQPYLGTPCCPRERMVAHALWAAHAKPHRAGRSRRLAGLDARQREALGHHLVALAASGRQLGPRPMRSLTDAYASLGLNATTLFALVHQATIGRAPLTPPASGAADGGVADRLDRDLVARKAAETAQIADFLSQIFVDDDAGEITSADAGATGRERPDDAPASSIAEPETGSLDAAHASFLRQLGDRPAWSRAELRALAAPLGLLLDGALDTLNEAALDATGDPVCEGDDPIHVNALSARQLLS